MEHKKNYNSVKIIHFQISECQPLLYPNVVVVHPGLD